MSKKPVAAGKSSFDLIRREDFFSNIDIDQDAQILDAACGIGLYSIEISKLLNENGLIHAVDFWGGGIELLNQAIREQGISNVSPIQADITEHIPLESGSIDLSLMATILHDLSATEQDATLKEIARVLNPEGTLALIEFKKIDKGPGPPITIRISPEEAEEKIAAYGFTLIRHAEIGDFNYLLNFRKTA